MKTSTSKVEDLGQGYGLGLGLGLGRSLGWLGRGVGSCIKSSTKIEVCMLECDVL